MMATQWERNRERLAEYVAKNGRLPTQNYKTDDDVALGRWISAQRQKQHKLTAKQRASLEQIAGWRWRIRETQKPVLADRAAEWRRKCELVRAYAAANGSPPINHRKAKDNVTLCHWISNQRKNRAKLTAEQRASLESIVGWRWQVLERQKPVLINRADEWKRKCDLVRKYVAYYKRLPSRSYEMADGTKLGAWMHNQRMYRASLTAERQASLESITGWRWRAAERRKPESINRATELSCELARLCAAINAIARADYQHRATDVPKTLLDHQIAEWEYRCKLVREYAAANGRPPNTTYVTDDNIALGTWISTQRRNRATLSAERRAALESIKGWQWQVLKRQKPVLSNRAKEWQRKCDLVRAYVADNGRLPTRSHKTYDGTALGVWLSTQRHNRTRLTAEQRASLESIDGWQWPSSDEDTEWARECAQLRECSAAKRRKRSE